MVEVAQREGVRYGDDLMSALGHKRTWEHVRPMYALPPKADIDHDASNVRFVPKANIGSIWKLRAPAHCKPPSGGGCP
jgi:hypothetical protein